MGYTYFAMAAMYHVRWQTRGDTEDEPYRCARLGVLTGTPPVFGLANVQEISLRPMHMFLEITMHNTGVCQLPHWRHACPSHEGRWGPPAVKCEALTTVRVRVQLPRHTTPVQHMQA